MRQKLSAKAAELERQKNDAKRVEEELKQQLDVQAGQLNELVVDRDESVKKTADALKAVERLRKQFEEVSASLSAKELELKFVSEDYELTLLQLQQVQEELENYFLFYSRQAHILSSTEDLLARASKLALRTIN